MGQGITYKDSSDNEACCLISNLIKTCKVRLLVRGTDSGVESMYNM